MGDMCQTAVITCVNFHLKWWQWHTFQT